MAHTYSKLVNRYYWIFFTAILFIAVNCYGQKKSYQFSSIDVNNGLSHNQITSIFKDKDGFMWFGTFSGLNRYDGRTFKIFKHSDADTSSISDNYIEEIKEWPGKKLWIYNRRGYDIYNPSSEKFEHNIAEQLKLFHVPDSHIKDVKKDRRGDFWFIHNTFGLYRYSTTTGKTLHFSTNSASPLYSNTISDMAEDTNGDFWIIYVDGVLEKINCRTNQVTNRTFNILKLYKNDNTNYNLFSDRQNGLWIFDPRNPIGVNYLDIRTSMFKHISKSTAGQHLKADIVTKITEDDNGIIWVGTDHGGINLINKKDFSVEYLFNKEDDIKTLRQNSITTMYRDYSGIVWIGTYKKGISYYQEDIIQFPLIKRSLIDHNTLISNDVNVFAEDSLGNLWIGTNDKGLVYYNRKDGTFKNYQNNPNNGNSLSNNVVVALLIDHNKKLWIGTYFGGLERYDGKKFEHYQHSDAKNSLISDNRIARLYEDSSNNLWVGTMGGGLDCINSDKNTVRHFNLNTLPAIGSNYISGIVEDDSGNIWIGTSYGLAALSKNYNMYADYKHSDVDKNSLVNDNITGLMKDSRHLLWITTRDGLSIFNPLTKQFTNLKKEDGLPDNTVLDVLEDGAHRMWISSANGLCNVVVKTSHNGQLTFRFKNYDETDGLQGREFNQFSSLKLKSGEMIFGGASGFNIFNPSNIHPGPNGFKLLLTDFLLGNQRIVPQQKINGHQILSRSITQTKSITLSHDENVFTIEFAALNFFDPDRVKYYYMMEGFDKDWLPADNPRGRATYTNLDAGDYIFKVKASIPNNGDNPQYVTLNIRIKPPFWKTPLAYACYLLAFFGALYYVRYRGIKKLNKEFYAEQERMEMKRALEQERSEARRMHELDLMKIKFFTNVSHEFRTPLALIMAPVDKLLKHEGDAEALKQANMIKINARRLLNLVNQLLDFRKMEVQELKLQTQKGDIVALIKEVSLSFTDIAEKKNIGFLFHSEHDGVITKFDHDKIERIMFNLLSNAFKFTPSSGHISVLLDIKDDNLPKGEKLLEIKVMDTGIGIPKELHEKIFNRFFQNETPASLINQGSGIGLAITREFVKMHNGEIFIESELDYGSCFIVKLPLPVLHDLDNQSNSNELTVEEAPGDQVNAVDTIGKKIKKELVLIVEDNDDFRFYLKDNLRGHYDILEASNGKEGWQKALSSHPDIMVSDVNMPEMNGIELCKKIKSDKRTSHIPVILLTAMTSEETELKGLQIGANDYVTKPFNFEILVSKIKNLLTLQHTFKETYKRQIHVQVDDIEVESADKKLLSNVFEHIQKNMQNPSLSVEDLSRQMNMSRVSLYKKLLLLTGKTPVELIRHIRLQKAIQLLDKTQLNINEVSYEVGCNNPTYFSKIFKEEFKILPSEYANIARKKNAEIFNS